MNVLNKESAVEFMQRFGRHGDGLLLSVLYNVQAGTAELRMEIMDAALDHQWTELRIVFSGVERFNYTNTPECSTVVIYDMNVEDFDGLLHFDFIAMAAEEGSFSFDLYDYVNSPGVCAAREISWEAKPIPG